MVSDNQAYRDPMSGSWFIKRLCKNLRRYAASKSLNDIITITTGDVGKFRGKDKYGKVVSQVVDKRYDSLGMFLHFSPKGNFLHFWSF